VLFIGPFTVNGTNRNTIARLNANGSLDNTFDAGGELQAHKMGLQPDGKILVAGSSTSAYQIARLNSDGSLDGSFNPSLPDPSPVGSLVAQSDGKVLVAGDFTSVNGTNRNGIARLNADGSLDSSFNPGTGSFGIASVVALQPDGKILIGGSFGSVNGTPREFIARLNADGSLDSSFDPGHEISGQVSSVVVQPDGKVLVGDVFTFINGTNRYASTRLNADGSLDSMFISDTNFRPKLGGLYFDDCGDPGRCSCYQSVVPFALVVQADGKVLIGGVSVTISECSGGDGEVISRPILARFNADGSLDGSFGLVIGNRDWGSVNALAVQPDGKVLVGGSFYSINGTNRPGIARLNANGSLDNSFNPGTGANGVSSVALQPDGKVLIGGGFTTVNGANRSGIARLNSNGSLDGSFNPGTGANGNVLSVALQPDGKVLIGGEFTSINGTNRSRISRLNVNGSLDSSFNPGTGPDGVVRSIAFQPDGNVLIGGDFTSVNGVLRPRVARLYGDFFAPSLSIARSNAFVIVSWPVTSLNFQLQENTDLSLPNAWSAVAQPAVTNFGQISVVVPASEARKFFRLKSP